ncbi:MAG: hypothetical protein IPJ67_01960 [Candidatus Moraniibacteriota bacterium]|nr:MAG: hypothetical protein IPJ67_01960 [Candidatus Moranbacteria bacterium]
MVIQTFQKYLRHRGETVREWLYLYGRRGLLSLGMLVALALAFEGGLLVGRDRQVAPVVVEKPAESCVVAIPETGAENKSNTSQKEPFSTESENATNKTIAASPSKEASSQESNQVSVCAFVGSRNSDKYHLPKCTWAKRIKAENRICFASAADAEAKGYKPGCVK